MTKFGFDEDVYLKRKRTFRHCSFDGKLKPARKIDFTYANKMIADALFGNKENCMTKEELATKLNGHKYCEEITEDEVQLAEDNNLVVIFGQSDDLMEFRGAINEEIGAWRGTSVLISKNGLVERPDIESYSDREEELDEVYEKYLNNKKTARKVEAIWCPKDENGKIYVSWIYKTEIPYTTFDIIEDDGGLYCRGIVIDLKNL